VLESELTLGTTKLPVGTLVGQMVYSVCRDPSNWGQNANEFDPSRWIEHYKSTTSDPPAFRVFGAGTRQCPGEKLASFDVRLFLGAIIREFDFKFENINGIDVILEISFAVKNAMCTVSVAK
jgi:PHYB activation tagged suppressor 1